MLRFQGEEKERNRSLRRDFGQRWFLVTYDVGVRGEIAVPPIFHFED